jgi:hypothetical protein
VAKCCGVVAKCCGVVALRNHRTFGTINDLIDTVNSLKLHVDSFSGCGPVSVNTQS